VDAAVGEAAERRGQVDRLRLDRADRPGKAGLQEGVASVEELDAELLGRVRDRVVADTLQRPDRGEVQ